MGTLANLTPATFALIVAAATFFGTFFGFSGRSLFTKSKDSRERLKAHNEELIVQIRDDGFETELRKSVALEAYILAIVEDEVSRLQSYTEDELDDMLSRYDPLWPHEKMANSIKKLFTKENAKWLGGKLVEKALGLANKVVGAAVTGKPG